MFKHRIRIFAIAALGIGAAGLFLGDNTLTQRAHAASNVLAADPSGEEVLQKYIEVTGGRAAYDKVKSRIVNGKMSIPQQGITGDIVIYQKTPNLSYMTINIPGIGLIERGNNGEVAWEKNPMQGTRILDGEEKEQADREATINSDLDWKKEYTKVENKGIEQINGKPAYKLEMTKKNGTIETRYYEVDNGLLAQTEMTVKNAQGEFPIVATASDSKAIDGIKMPMKSTQDLKSMGIQQVITMDKVQTNADIPADKFKLPDDVKAMVDKKGPTTEPSKEK